MEKLAKATPRWIVAFSLAVMGIAAGWFGPIQILLPVQAADLASGSSLSKEALLALVTGVGAAASMIANPLWGVLSDRLRTRWGGRRPVVVLGTAVAVVGFLLLASASSVAAMVLGWLSVQVGLNGPFAALAAMIADHVPEVQRGLVGAMFGIAQTIGVVLGTAIAVATGEGALGYVALAIAVPALSVAILLIHREDAPLTAEAPTWSAFAGGLRPTWLFTWAWLIRFIVNTVNALVLLYMYYYLTDAVKLGDDEVGTWVLVITAVTALISAITAGIAGPWSDRIGRRRPFVALSAIIVAVAAGVLAFVPQIGLVVVAAAVLGVGWGLYLAVDLAIITATLPADGTRATMLGVANIASASPQVLAPVIAAPIVTSQMGYPGMYGLAAGLSLSALALIPRLRGIR